jgi:hypothetical protein
MPLRMYSMDRFSVVEVEKLTGTGDSGAVREVPARQKGTILLLKHMSKGGYRRASVMYVGDVDIRLLPSILFSALFYIITELILSIKTRVRSADINALAAACIRLGLIWKLGLTLTGPV